MLDDSWLTAWQQVPESKLKDLCVPGFLYGKGRDTLDVLRTELGLLHSLDVLKLLFRALSLAVADRDDQPFDVGVPASAWQQRKCLGVVNKINMHINHPDTGKVVGSIRYAHAWHLRVPCGLREA